MHKPITIAERSMLSREIGRAQERLENARKMAHLYGEARIAKNLGEQLKALGEQISQIHGGPLVLSVSELAR